jgi:alginate O-acetyltransferase complex protein AlgJ
MWKPRQPTLVVVASLAVVLGGTAAAGATPDPTAPHGVRSGVLGHQTDLSHAWDRDGTLEDGVPIRAFHGQDGLTYQASPPLVQGSNGTVFFGEEFDAACAYGKRFDKGLARISKLARAIERSGRRVVFTVAPNKSAVDKAALAGVQLPHGYCDAEGIAQQDHTLDSFRDKDFLPLRSKLANSAANGVDEYWQVDTHWTSIGATQWAYDLAKKLDPRLARQQSYRADTESLQVDLSFLGLIGEIVETAVGRATTTKVNVAPDPGTNVFDPNTPSPTVGWSARPKSRTWPGTTLLLGDSFTYRSMDPLMHLFNRGQFLWIGHTPLPSILDGIVASDTVVIEVVQRYVAASLVTMKSFRKAVEKAIAKHPR